MRTTTLEIIEVVWQGPYSPEQVVTIYNQDVDRGLYQFYGTHDVFGPDSLLYIGQTFGQTFAERISQQDIEFTTYSWIPSASHVYLGRLGGVELITKAEWKKQVDDAEQLLIFFANPPFNTNFVNRYGEIEHTALINAGRRHRLPMLVSTLVDDSDCFLGTEKWQVFGGRHLRK